MDYATQSPDVNGGGTATIDIHQPFTAAERIQQLSQVDNDIASLLTHLSSAIRALATPPSSSSSNSHNNSDSSGDVLILDNPAEPAATSSDPLTSFKSAQTSFFQTVDRIDKQLTRQIFALEEAGIITLRGGGGSHISSDQQQQHNQDQSHQQQQQQQHPQHQQQAGGADGAGGAAARLEPNGIGRYGKLDVGQLNMASSRVERDFEGELWRRAREHLEGVVREEEDRMKE
ncbi:hypothetical protein MMYC01_207918 [Madurella mycetomatis]|uniref:Mediator of RNA polymerase II transcription subunit 11 n=1 Tax=Madurella mycetomatis TaxID=100816 RepID=A0A175VUM1_9PEZI|nr:hypothetical protein MMYC01_207918 [Madurella mycetomatis]